MAEAKKIDELVVSLKNGKLYLGEKAAAKIKQKPHLCGECLVPYGQCPKMSKTWQPIEYYGWITEGSQTFIAKEMLCRLSAESQMDLFNSGKYKDKHDVPDSEKISLMVPDTFTVTECQKYVSSEPETMLREEQEKRRIRYIGLKK